MQREGGAGKIMKVEREIEESPLCRVMRENGVLRVIMFYAEVDALRAVAARTIDVEKLLINPERWVQWRK